MATATSTYLRRFSEERKTSRRKETAKVEDSYFPDVSAIDLQAGVLKDKPQSATTTKPKSKRVRAKSASPRYEPAPVTSSTFLTEELHRILHDRPTERLKTELEETRAALREKELGLAKAQDEAEATKMRYAQLELEKTRELREFSERENEYKQKLISTSVMEGYWEGFSEGLYAGIVNAPRVFSQRVRSKSAGEADLGAARPRRGTSILQASPVLAPTSPTISTISSRATQQTGRPRRRSWLPRPASSDVSSIVESVLSGTSAALVPPVPSIPNPKLKRTVTVRSDPEVFGYETHEEERSEPTRYESPSPQGTPSQRYAAATRDRPIPETSRHRSVENVSPRPVVESVRAPEPPIQRASTSSPTPRDRRRRSSVSSQRSNMSYFRDREDAPPVPDLSAIMRTRRRPSETSIAAPSSPKAPSTPSSASYTTFASDSGRTASPPPRPMSHTTGSQYSLPGSSVPTIVPAHTPPPSSPQPSMRKIDTMSTVSHRRSPSQPSAWRGESSSIMSAEPSFEVERQQRSRKTVHPDDSSAKISTSTTLSQMNLLRSPSGTSQWPYDMPVLTNDTSSVTTRAISPSTGQWPFDGSAPGVNNTTSEESTIRGPGIVTSESSNATQRIRKPRDFVLPEPEVAKPLPTLPPPNAPVHYVAPRPIVQLDTPTSEESPGNEGATRSSPKKLLAKLRQRLLNRSHSTPANELPTIKSRFGKPESSSPLALETS